VQPGGAPLEEHASRDQHTDTENAVRKRERVLVSKMASGRGIGRHAHREESDLKENDSPGLDDLKYPQRPFIHEAPHPMPNCFNIFALFFAPIFARSGQIFSTSPGQMVTIFEKTPVEAGT
jgi:hypothetical protein